MMREQQVDIKGAEDKLTGRQASLPGGAATAQLPSRCRGGLGVATEVSLKEDSGGFGGLYRPASHAQGVAQENVPCISPSSDCEQPGQEG